MTHLEILTYLNRTFSARFYLVGGFVRDLLNGKTSDDYDIATDLLPEKLLELAKEKNIIAIPTGIKHGTTTLIIDNKNLEITTFRQDFNNNGRHCSVLYTDKIQLDASRRDFTINAIYMDEFGNIYDFFDGEGDLKRGLVKFIGDPERRIQEDYLRILRFFRFSAEFDTSNKSLTQELIKTFGRLAPKLSLLSKERITQEFCKICEKENFIKSFMQMQKIEVLKNRYNLDTNFSGISTEKMRLIRDWDSFYKLCLVYFDNLNDLLCNKNFLWSKNRKQVLKNLINVLKEDNIIHNLKKLSVKYNKEIVEFAIVVLYFKDKILKEDFQKYKTELKTMICPKFEITGHDLMDIGFVKGKTLGQALSQVYDFWLENDFPKKELCLNFARTLFEKQV